MAKYKWDNLIFFVEQLSSALSMKLPMDKTIDAMSNESIDRGWRKAQKNISSLLGGGKSLSEAMNTYPQYFPEILRRLVRAGEEGNVLPAMLMSVSGYLQTVREIRHKLQKCLIYPFLVWTFLLIDFLILFLYCLPNLSKMFLNMESNTPQLTQLFLSMGPVLLILVDGLIFFLAWIVIGWVGMGTGGSSRFFGKLNAIVKYIPFLGTMQRHSNAAELCEMLGVLVEGGHSGREAVRIAKESVNNPSMLMALEEMDSSFYAGGTSSRYERTFIPHTTLWMLSQANESGLNELGKSLRNLAGYHRRQLDMISSVIREFLEPLLLLAVAVIGAFALIGLYIALFKTSMMVL